ncbi:MAG: hypothetical protein Q8L13_06545, partial [Bradyrhizobium sp.]|uniref:hypothetical protein n=1 Tax=Bradyrhizobium sp. TaxID=376 RepID=UPI0027310596
TVPMGGVFCRKGIYDAFMNAPEGQIELFHGYTYSAHPLACAAAQNQNFHDRLCSRRGRCCIATKMFVAVKSFANFRPPA